VSQGSINQHPVAVSDLIALDIADLCRDKLGLPEPLSFASIRTDRVHIDLAFAAEYLTEVEQDLFRSFRYVKRQRQWLGGRIAAKAAVARFHNWNEDFIALPWHDWKIIPDENGRPIISYIGAGNQLKPPYISISHSGDLATAMAAPCNCGLDIQEITNTVARVRKRFLTNAEEELIKTLLPMNLDEQYRLSLVWAAKEAVRKTIAVSPLLGFMEIRLQKIMTGQNGFFLLQFELLPGLNRTEHAADGGSGVAIPPVLAAMAFYHQDYAAAFTGVAPTTMDERP